MEKKVSEAISILIDGGIVVFPTDTAFGIGCRMDYPTSVEKLFRLRRRPKTQPAPVLVDSIHMAETYLTSPLPDNVRHLMKTYWPGALTIIYYCTIESVPPLVRGCGKTLGVRQPDHPTALQLIAGVGIPLLGPSANFHGGKTPFAFADLDANLLRHVDYVLRGECTHNQPSTVINCTTNPFGIVRRGAVNLRKEELV